MLEANARTYVDQAAKVLDMDKVELTRNGDWLGPLRMNDVLKLTSTVTVARMLERDDFSKRYAANEPISMLEFMYPLLQGYDSVAVRADIELGGTDQKFNLLMGRTIMEAYGLPPQSILTVPLLVGTDGEQKMSKSYGNYVGVSDEPGDMFGKIMSIPDELMVTYMSLVTDASVREVEALAEGRWPTAAITRRRPSATWPSGWCASTTAPTPPRRPGPGSTGSSRRRTGRRTSPRRSCPPGAVRDGKVWLPRLLTETGLVASNGEARRLIEQGGVRIDDQVVSDPGRRVRRPRRWRAWSCRWASGSSFVSSSRPYATDPMAGDWTGSSRTGEHGGAQLPRLSGANAPSFWRPSSTRTLCDPEWGYGPPATKV